ncbi:PAS domain S-box-containing protein [Rhizobium sp. 1399]|nr:PAS domain S-box-containing protein [Rhizobium sp. 1399]
MFSVIACIRDNHDWRLVVAAVIVCLVGSLTTMLLLFRAQECDVGQRKLWIGTSAFACGVGVWATHFIAMLAYDGGMPISYDLRLTFLSVFLSIFGSWVAILIASEGRTGYSLAFSGLLMALGITAMHMTGMQAIEAPAVIVYDAFTSVVAFCSCAVLATVAFLVFFQLKGMKRFAASSGAFVLAICTLHFISMSSITLVPDPTREVPAMALQPEVLAVIVMVVATGLILMAFGAVFLESHLTDLRGLANVSQEGLVILREGRIIDTNERFLTLSGWKLAELTGNIPSAVLALIHVGQESDHREMLLIAKDEREIRVEVVTRRIVYRGRHCDVLVVRDLTQHRRAGEMSEHLAHHDVSPGSAGR